MKIVVIGASGTIGKAVVKRLSTKHQVIEANYQDADNPIDMTDASSIHAFLNRIGKVDAVVMTTGKTPFKPLVEMTSEDYRAGLQHKLMGQVNVVLIAQQYLNDGGSLTLTSGILNKDPIASGSSAAMVNGAIEGFVKNAALELPSSIRINVVSPTVITESLDLYGDFFPGFKSISADDAALAYQKSVEGIQTGKIYCVN